MAGRVAGKRALVTGAAQGLGAQAATTLAREGARVLCTDINGDGAVTGADLGILLALWGDPSTLPSADVSGDGRLDGADLGLLLAAWGPCE